ncbi:hypothetical protein [Rhizobium sp. BK176]|uniref:hypothetical protein n=1 Tax=Rhizobium sp. BK176 TaxID=2587071 RepID=UPI00216A7F93|nr:hypothetical protein [Rhizobium sp. BK176]MCS4090033.1 hypothetical protein [Rhizobium sp. BK176]
MKKESDVPRWPQGLRPGSFGEVWDAMKPSERRRAFLGDILLAFGGAAALYWLVGVASGA